MTRVTCFILYLILALYCSACAIRGETELVTISGWITDAQTGQRLSSVPVELQVRKQQGLFRMSSFVLSDTAESGDRGQFEFSVGAGADVQIVTRSTESGRLGQPRVFEDVETDLTNIEIAHVER